ncbi:MAG TPA: hypothetical protein VFO97_07380 [Desertimonas sp.]|nr:hypothetical protein [Desertimonas sp.]
MEHACVNPYCSCAECDCEPPCSCGLALVGHSTEEVWDAGPGELRYTVTSRYRHEPGRRRGHGEYDVDDDDGHDHGDHGGGGTISDGSSNTVTLGAVQIGEPAELLVESLADDSRRAAVLAGYQETIGAAAHSHEHASVRTAEHNGHSIEIRTTYDVRIDGEPLEAHLGVGNDGNVHYHGLPNYTEASAIDLMRRVIDAFPDDYPPDDGHDDHDREE